MPTEMFVTTNPKDACGSRMSAMLFVPPPKLISVVRSIELVDDSPEARGGTIGVAAVVSRRISTLPTVCGSDVWAQSSSRSSRARDAHGGAAESRAGDSRVIQKNARWASYAPIAPIKSLRC